MSSRNDSKKYDSFSDWAIDTIGYVFKFVLTGCITSFICGDSETKPIYYNSELDEFYTEDGQDIYKITMKVPSADYPCEKVGSARYQTQEGYQLIDGVAYKTIYNDDGSENVVLGDIETIIDNYYIVTENVNGGLFGNKAKRVTYLEDDIKEMGAIYDEVSNMITFPDRYYISYSFEPECSSEFQNSEVIDIEKIETAEFDNSLLDKVVNMTDRIENVAPEQGRALEKLY